MILDDAITAALIIAVATSLLCKKGAAFAVLLLSSHAFSLAVHTENPPWDLFIAWLYIVFAKDFVLVGAFGFMRGRHSFILMLTFVATCVFHQLILAQALTGKVDNLTLLALRPDLMKFIVVAQLSTVYHAIITGGADDGGGLAKCDKFFLHYRLGFIFHKPSFKVKR